MPYHVTHEAERHRFAIHDSGETAVLTYHEEPRAITFVHTEVPPSLRGQGLGEELVRVGFEYARENHLLVIPRCPFVASYLKSHPEFADLVDPESR